MKTNQLSLPKQSPIIVVDPLKGFTEGSFVQCYGEIDTQPIRDVVANLEIMTQAWQEQARLILCKSQYTKDQFSIAGLEELCTTDAERESAIEESRFTDIVSKNDNSLLSANIELAELLGKTEYLGITGLTTTSCVRKTIDDIREHLDQIIVVPEDAVATRKKREIEGKFLLRQWSSANEQKVIVVPSWRNIEFES